MSAELEKLKDYYQASKEEIRKKLTEFKKVSKKSPSKIFSELCFCLLTPQSNAEVCTRAIKKLEEEKLLFTGNIVQITQHLKGVRFPKKKAAYIVSAREKLGEKGKIKIKDKLKGSPSKIRDWLVENIQGLGLKEASHFLRNIGLGKDLAILDRHVLSALVKFRVIKKIPANLSRKHYLELENRMRFFSSKLKIPLSELDLLLWSYETGKILK